MSESINHSTPTSKIYQERAISVGTFLGGPLVAGYLFAKNFKALGQPEKVKTTWTVTIIATIIIFGLVLFIPEETDIPNFIIPISYCAIALGLFKKYQEDQALEHIQKGGPVYGWGNVIGVGIVGLFITMIPIFTYVYFTESIAQANISSKKYGITVQHEISFDQSNIPEKEVDRIAEAFTETGFFDLSVAKYVYVAKNESKYELLISVVPGIENDDEALQPFIMLREDMDKYLPDHQVEIKLVVDYLDNVVKVLK